jgi:hypothetical protein
MNRLDTELRRLYLPHLQPGVPQQAEPVTDASPALLDADGQVRALVLELACAAGWDGVAALWQGMQNELELPAPAIAISGQDGYQVWISLSEPVSVAQARAFLESLCRRFLAGIAPRHVRLQPSLEADAPDATGMARHARLVPALQAESGHWSAFIAPNLAAMFADEPWLEMPPGPDAQADLLLRLKSLSPAEFRQAQQQLTSAEAAPASAASPLPAAMPDQAAAARSGSDVEASAATEGQDRLAASAPEADPRRFLLAVMNDPAAELRWRIEAAKALLPYSTR